MARNINKLLQTNNVNFTTAINYTFYVSKVYGLIPYSLINYYQSKILKNSIFGNILSIAFLLSYVCSYHFILAATYFDGKSFDSGNFNDWNGI